MQYKDTKMKTQYKCISLQFHETHISISIFYKNIQPTNINQQGWDLGWAMATSIIQIKDKDTNIQPTNINQYKPIGIGHY